MPYVGIYITGIDSCVPVVAQGYARAGEQRNALLAARSPYHFHFNQDTRISWVNVEPDSVSLLGLFFHSQMTFTPFANDFSGDFSPGV